MIEKKKILLVSSAFYPEISPRSFRATELAKEFCREGHDVTVISKYRNFDYTLFLNDYPILFRMWKKPLLSAIPSSKVKSIAFMIRGFIRLLSILFEYPAILEMFKVRRMLKREKEYDLMISFAVPFPVHWGVAWSRNKRHLIAQTWVADCGDAFMFARLDTFRKPFYFKYLEKGFCRKCDHISIPFRELGDQFYPEFKSKMRVIPQGFNFNEIRLFEEPLSNSKPTFLFAGSVIPGLRDLRLLFDYLISISHDFLFIVYTKQTSYYENYKTMLGDKLAIKPYIDRLSLIYEMSKIDFLVNIDTVHDKENNIEAIPSKLIDYALANRPIMNINSTQLDKKLVIEFFNQDYSRQRVIDKSKFDITVVGAKFLALMN